MHEKVFVFYDDTSCCSSEGDERSCVIRYAMIGPISEQEVNHQSRRILLQIRQQMSLISMTTTRLFSERHFDSLVSIFSWQHSVHGLFTAILCQLPLPWKPWDERWRSPATSLQSPAWSSIHRSPLNPQAANTVRICTVNKQKSNSNYYSTTAQKSWRKRLDPKE